jgi:hypothetical protein
MRSDHIIFIVETALASSSFSLFFFFFFFFFPFFFFLLVYMCVKGKSCDQSTLHQPRAALSRIVDR